MEKLFNLYEGAVASTELRERLKPKGFPREMARMLARYNSGVQVGDAGRKVRMRNHWATPRKLLNKIYEAFHDLT
eukprot:3609731-Pyramimonas_sp.AAC.2